MNNLKNSIFGSYCDIETREEMPVDLEFEHFYFPIHKGEGDARGSFIRGQGDISTIAVYIRNQDSPPTVNIEFYLEDKMTKIILEAPIMDALATSCVEFVNKFQEHTTDNNDERVFVDEQSRIVVGKSWVNQMGLKPGDELDIRIGYKTINLATEKGVLK